MPEPQTMEPISLGYACDVKYQISRNLYFRIHPRHAYRQFRNDLFRWKTPVSLQARNIFDWRITPYPAVCAYLENDFQGIFERRDLHVGDDGEVHHRTLACIYPHDFRKGPDGRMTEALIDAQYEQARAKFDYLADRFRAHLSTPGPYLYVMGEIRPLGEVKRLVSLLQARSAEHRFHLLLVDKAGAVNQVLSELRGTVSKGWLPHETTKTGDRLWEGDDSAWDAILDRFPLGLPGVPLASPPTALQSQFGKPPGELSVDSPPPSGWRSALAATPESFRSVFDHVGDAEALAHEDGGPRFRGAGADDHIFCQYQPVRPGLDSWARIRFAWPKGAARAGVQLQDQDCYNPSSRWVEGADADETVLLARLSPEMDHLRLVFTPVEGGGALPLTVEMDIHDPAPSARPADGPLAGLRRLLGRLAS